MSVMAEKVPSRDRALLERLSHGDAEAFWSLWIRHRPHLHAVCYRQMQRVRADADDAVSRSMLLAHAKLPEYAQEINDVEAWLTRLTCNVCLDIKKERGRGARKAASLDESALVRREASLPDPPSPEETCLLRQVRECVRIAIESLPPAIRIVAQLRFVDEASYSAISEHLGITEANARKRVQQARALLRPQLIHLLRRDSLGLQDQELGIAGAQPD